MASYTNDQLTSTLQILLKKQRNSVFKKSPLLDLLLKKAVKFDGGLRIDFGFGVNEHSTVTQYISGAEAASMSAADTSILASSPFSTFDSMIHVTRVDELRNQGPSAMGSLLARRAASVFSTLKNEAEKQLLAGNSTILTELNSFEGVTNTTGAMEELAVGSQTNTICGVSKTGRNVLHNQFANVNSNFATNGLLAMRKVRDAADEVASVGDIDLVIASMLSFGLYGDTLTAQARFTSKEDLDGGNASLMFDKAKIYPSSRFSVAANQTGGVGLSMYMLNTENIETYVHRDANFKQSPFINYANGQNGRFARVEVSMQVVPLALNCHGIICNADA